MQNQLIIRATTREDCADIASMAQATDLFPADMLDGMIAGYLDRSNPDIWLTAVLDARPVGFAFCEPERMTVGTWNLLAIAVSPRRQGQGIGATLVAHLEVALRRDGHRVLLVETIGSPEFLPTQAFYSARDFVEEARIRDFYDVGTDKVVFWKEL